MSDPSSTQVVVAVIGSITTIIVALIGARIGPRQATDESDLQKEGNAVKRRRKIAFASLFSMGISITALIISLIAGAGRITSVDGTLPIGSIVPFIGGSDEVPNNWQLCNGDDLRRDAAPILRSILRNGRVPNLHGCFLKGTTNSGEYVLMGGTNMASISKIRISEEPVPHHTHKVSGITGFVSTQGDDATPPGPQRMRIFNDTGTFLSDMHFQADGGANGEGNHRHDLSLAVGVPDNGAVHSHKVAPFSIESNPVHMLVAFIIRIK